MKGYVPARKFQSGSMRGIRQVKIVKISLIRVAVRYISTNLKGLF